MFDLKKIKILTDASDVTPSHVKVEVVQDDINPDANTTINIGEEEVDQIRLMLDEYDALVHAFEKESMELDRIENYVIATEAHGIDPTTRDLILHDYPELHIPTVDHLSQPVPDGIETKIALESMVALVEKIYNGLKSILDKVVEILDRMMKTFHRLFGTSNTAVADAYAKIKQMHVVDIKLNNLELKAVPFAEWDRASSNLTRIEKLRTAVLMSQFANDILDSKNADRALNGILTPIALASAMNGTLDPNDAKPMIQRWMMQHIPMPVMKFIGIATAPNGDIEVMPAPINKDLQRRAGTFNSLQWSSMNIERMGVRARGLMEFGNSLPRLFSETRTTTKRRIVQIEHSINERYQPNTIKGLRRDRFRYRVYLIALGMSNKAMWHMSKLSVHAANEWLHIAKIAIKKGAL